MCMVMTTGKTLMMAGMQGAISLDTTITILNQHIPRNGWPAVPAPATVNNQTTDSQQLPTSSTAHARASPTVGVQVTDGSFFWSVKSISILTSRYMKMVVAMVMIATFMVLFYQWGIVRG